MVPKPLKVLHYPTLKTVLMVEGILKQAKEPLSRYELMKRAEKKIMRQTLNIVIKYLVERNLALDTGRGVVWRRNALHRIGGWFYGG